MLSICLRSPAVVRLLTPTISSTTTSALSLLSTPTSVQSGPTTFTQRRWIRAPFGKKPARMVPKPPVVEEAVVEVMTKEESNYDVRRTNNQWLPVYKEFRNNRNSIETRIKRIEGDIQQLARDLESIVPRDRITIKPNTRHIILKGDYTDNVRDWFTSRGF
ncbi:hypothetical protein HK102_000596 [Quaeritorhiza haematococci]|nr:hypothetical protein HK102_000596 [Quaeritorhiza haematococci]